MNVRMMPPQGPMGQPMPMGGAPAPMPPQGGPMMPPAPTTPQSQQGKGLGSAFGGSASGRQGFKQFMAAKKQTSAMVPQVAQAQMPRPSPVQAPQPMLPAPSPQMMGAMRPMGGGQASMPVQAGRPMRGTQGGLGSAPVQLNRGGVVDMAPTDGQLGLFVGGQRQDSVPGVYQKMLRAGLPRDEAFGEIESLRDSAMHVAEDLGKFLETPHAGFEHSHGDFRAAGFADGGEVEIPRETEIMGVPHYLAYIQPEEGDILEDLGGLGEPIGPGGIPTYIIHKGWSESSFNPSNWGGGGGGNDNTTSMPSNTSVDFTTIDLNTGTQTPVATIDYGDDDDDDRFTVTYHDDKPSVSTTTTQPVSTGTLIDLSGADLDLGTFGGAGIDVGVPGIDTSYATSTAWEPPGFDFDNDGISGEGSDVLDNNVDNPFVDIDDDPVTPVTPTYDPSDDVYVGSPSDETDFTQPVYTPVVDTTPSPPPPPPKYYDMFGGEHSSQAAADAADAKYTAEAVAAEAVETVTSTPSDTTYSYTGADTDAGSDTDPASVYESSIFREASVPLPGGAGPTSEDIMPGITGTEAGVGAGERTEAEENALRALYNMDPIGVDADEDDDLKTAVEDIYNIGLEGEFGGLDLDVPEAEAEVGLEKASAEFPTGPFETPEMTGLEEFEDDRYAGQFPETVDDFTISMPDMARDEMVENLKDYYTTGAGADGATQDVYMPTDESFTSASEDMSALDEIAAATALEFEDLYPDSDDTLSIEVDEPNIIDFDIRDPEEDTGLFPEDEGEDEIVVGGEDDQQTSTTTTASQDYLSAMNKLDDPNSMTEAEQRALYGARGQVPNAAETAYLQSLLGNAKHKEDGPIGADGEPIYKAGDYVTEQSLGDMFEDALIFGLDTFVNPLSILGDKFTLEGQQDAYIQEQLDAYKNGGTFVYAEDGKTVIGVAEPNYDADNDGVNDTVVLNNENNDFSSGDDDIIVTSDGISVDDVEINDDVDGENEDDDIEIVYSDTTFENTEDGVVETNVGGTDTQTGGDDPCNDGYYLDPTTNACTPLDGVGTEEGDAEAARITLSLRKIDRGGGDVTLPTPTPVEGEALTIRKPQQFFEGGGVYGPDSDQSDYDRYYVRDNVVYTDYGPGVSTYQIGEGEDPSAIINFLDQQGFRETAPADSMDDGSAFLGFGGNQTTQGQQGQTSLPVFNPDVPEPTDPTIPDYETPVDPDPIADPLHDPRKMIIRAPKQFRTAYDGVVFSPDSGPRNLDPYAGQRINRPAQFAQGGMVTPNIDRFLQSLGA